MSSGQDKFGKEWVLSPNKVTQPMPCLYSILLDNGGGSVVDFSDCAEKTNL